MNRAPLHKFAAWSALAALGLVFVPNAAWAQGAPTAADSTKAAGSEPAAPSEEAMKEAASRYDTGLKLYAEGEFRLAVIEFEKTYQLTSDYRVLYNIGQVRIQLGNYSRAIVALKAYLEKGGDKISDDRKKAVGADLEMLAGRTSTVKITANVAGADILVDDLSVGQAPLAEPLLLDAGEHRVTAKKQGYEPKTLPLTLAGRDTMELKIDLVKLQEQGPIIVEKQVQKESDPTWEIAAWTTTGVLAVGAGVTYGLGVKAANDLDEMRKEEGSSNDERDSQSRRARTLLLAGDIMAGAAIVTGGVALYLTLSGPSEDKPPQAKSKPVAGKTGLLIGPNRIAIKGTF
jgi:hypothetical protein